METDRVSENKSLCSGHLSKVKSYPKSTSPMSRSPFQFWRQHSYRHADNGLAGWRSRHPLLLVCHCCATEKSQFRLSPTTKANVTLPLFVFTVAVSRQLLQVQLNSSPGGKGKSNSSVPVPIQPCRTDTGSWKTAPWGLSSFNSSGEGWVLAFWTMLVKPQVICDLTNSHSAKVASRGLIFVLSKNKKKRKKKKKVFTKLLSWIWTQTYSSYLCNSNYCFMLRLF